MLGEILLKKEVLGYFYLVCTIIFFSTYEVVSKTLVGRINPIQINFIRFLIGGILLFVLLALKKDIKINTKDLFWAGIVGIINVVISMSLLQLSIYVSDSKASVVAVIFSSNPIFVAVFAGLFEKEKIGLYKVLGLSIGVIGLLTIFFEKISLSVSDYKCHILAILSAVFYGLYTVAGRKLSMKIGSLKMNSYSFIIGSIALLPFLIAFDLPVIRFDYSSIFQVVYLSVFVTGLAYYTYFKGLSIIGASSGSLVFFIKPALASFIAIIFLKEQPTVNLALGTILVIFGIMVTVYSDRIKQKIM